MIAPRSSATPSAPSAAAPTPASAPPRRRGRPKGSRSSSPPLKPATASPQARRVASVLLEVLAGVRSTRDAATALGLSPVRFYAVEERAFGGLIAACEPRPSGLPPALSDARELSRLRTLGQRQAQELNQLRSLLRTAQRQLGVATAEAPTAHAKPAASSGGKAGDAKPTKARVRRPTVRALTLVRRLLRGGDDAVAAGAAVVDDRGLSHAAAADSAPPAVLPAATPDEG